MKRIFTFILLSIFAAAAFAQAPQKLSYQAVIRNTSDLLVTNTTVGMQISILQGSATGTVVYSETQTPTTNANGLVSIEIGGGTGFDAIDWSNGPYFIKTETDITGGTTYTISGTSELLSVPYALHAKTAESVVGGITETDPVFDLSAAATISATDITNWNNKLSTEVDGDVTNEIQILSISNDTIRLTNGGFIKLPAGFDGDYNSLINKPTIPVVPTNVSAFTNDAGYLNSFTEVDGSVTNELQILSISNDTIRLTNGGFVKLPAGFDGDYNSLINKPTIPVVPTNVSAFTNDAGYLTSFTEIDGDVTNELQILSISNDTIRLTNGGYVKLPAGFDGQYNSLTGTPTNVSAFTNDAGYLTSGDNLGNHTATQNIILGTNKLVGSGSNGIKIDAYGNIGINMDPQYTSNNDANIDLLASSGWGHANLNLHGFNWATTNHFCARGSGTTSTSGLFWSDEINEHVYRIYLDGDATKGCAIRKNGFFGIGVATPSSKLDVNGVITATGGNSTNWNTAFGWGNHAGLYRPVSWVPDWTDVTNKPSFALVATSGSYNDLSDKPLLFDGQYSSLSGAPTNVSTFTNDAGYLTSFTEVDGDVTNELQSLSLVNDSIKLSLGGGAIKISEPALISRDDFACTSLKNYWSSSVTGTANIVFNNAAVTLNTNSSGSTAKLYSNKQKSVTQGKLIFKTVCYTYEDNNTAYGPLVRGLVNGTNRNNAIEIINISGNTIQARTVSSGVATTTNYAIGASVGNYYAYTIIASDTKVEFYIDGVLFATHTTNIPTTALNMYFDVSTWSGNVPQVIDDCSFEIVY